MKHFAWSAEKNEVLRKQRGIGFEDIVFHIESGDAVAVLDHHNPVRYPKQKIFVVLVEAYAYLVPFVESDTEVFLKTIIPSRKATQHYAGDPHDPT